MGQARQAQVPIRREAADALEQVIGVEVRLDLDLGHTPTRTPAIVPIGAHRVGLGHLVGEPVVHAAARTVGDHGRVDPLEELQTGQETFHLEIMTIQKQDMKY